MDIRSGAERATGTCQNYRPNLVFCFDLVQCLNDRIDQLIVESIQLSRTFKRKNGHRFTIAAGENVGIHNDLNWRFVQLPVNPPTINPRTELDREWTQTYADWNTNREWTRMDANKRGERVFTGLYQLLRKTVRASTE